MIYLTEIYLTVIKISIVCFPYTCCSLLLFLHMITNIFLSIPLCTLISFLSCTFMRCQASDPWKDTLVVHIPVMAYIVSYDVAVSPRTLSKQTTEVTFSTITHTHPPPPPPFPYLPFPFPYLFPSLPLNTLPILTMSLADQGNG